MDKERFLKLMGRIYDIQKMGRGKNGFPYIEVSSSNYTDGLEVRARNGGFGSGNFWDVEYWFGIRTEISERAYEDCMKHLEELKQRAEGFVESKVHDEKEK